jgi:hypothetical protein
VQGKLLLLQNDEITMAEGYTKIAPLSRPFFELLFSPADAT